MARGTQHRKRRPRPHARTAASAIVAPAKPRKQKPPQWQDQLFFARLRAHAKWMFVLLAIVFALGFVVFGVGSGSNGVSSALQNAFNFGGGGTTGPSISSLQKKVDAHPKDAASWRALATAYETKHETQLAITALERYTTLKPKDTSSLQELASQYTSLADTYNTQAQNAEIAAQTANLAPSFLPSSTSTIGKAFATGGPLRTRSRARTSARRARRRRRRSVSSTPSKRRPRVRTTGSPNSRRPTRRCGSSSGRPPRERTTRPPR